MAEYKVFHCPHGDDFEGGDECDRCEKYELCMETPNADVIERSKYESIRNQLLKNIDEKAALSKANRDLHSKVDKAIEELRKEIEENHLNVIDYADGEWIVKDFVYGAIERFKRNIGE